MKRFRLAISAALVGVVLATGCAGPCGGCGGFHRMSMFRARRGCCPCECCSSCGGGVPIVGGGAAWGDGPLLESPASPLSAMPPLSTLPPPGGMTPAPFPPSLGAPLGTPAMPGDPRLTPIPNLAQPVPAESSSRIGRR